MDESLYAKKHSEAVTASSERSVQRVFSLLLSWENPFKPSDTLLNIASGITASLNIERGCLRAIEIGEKGLRDFIENRLQKQLVGFCDRSSQTKLKTFSTMLKTSRHKVDNSKVCLKADRGLFARMVVIAQSKLLDMKESLNYELGPIPWSLATGDGGLVKTQKSKVLEILEKTIIDSLDLIPPCTATMIDAMALLQSITHAAPTFGGITEQIFSMLQTYLRTPGISS